MRVLAMMVALLATAEFALVGGDALFRGHSDEMGQAALIGIAAGWLGLVTVVALWRRAPSALRWFVAWAITSGLFILLMPVLALRHSAPEEHFSRSVLFAVLFGCAFAFTAWRLHREFNALTESRRSDPGSASSAPAQRRIGKSM